MQKRLGIAIIVEEEGLEFYEQPMKNAKKIAR